MQLTKFEKIRIIQVKGKTLSVADLLGRSFTQKVLQLKQWNYKNLSPQSVLQH